MCIAAVVAKENISEHIDDSLSITVFGKQFLISELWSNSSEVKSHICTQFKNLHLFN